MHEELTLLPCPACGNPNVVVNVTTRAAVYCPDCGMYGPCAPTFSKEYAIRQWNSLLRALEWTNEPPKMPGWYWHRCEEGVVTMRRVWKGDIETPSKISQQWAGPMLEPREPKESVCPGK